VLLKYLSQQLGTQKSSSIYVMQLFGGGTPAKSIAKLAGLPKPPNCI
jgi:tRNA 2-thiouridine synthesizing protein E